MKRESESLRLSRSFRIAWRSAPDESAASLAAATTASLPRLSVSLVEFAFWSLNWPVPRDWPSGRELFWSIFVPSSGGVRRAHYWGNCAFNERGVNQFHRGSKFLNE